MSTTEEKKPGNPLFIAGMAVLLVGNLVGTAFVAMKVMKPAKAEAAHEKIEAPGSGPVLAMDPYVVNLNEPGSTRFLKVNFEVQVVSTHAQDDLIQAKRIVRDEVLRYLSSLTVADTLGEVGKSKIRDEITFRIERAVGPGKIYKVYLTEFVVQ